MVNETKVLILSLLSDGRWWTPPEVSRQLGLGLTNTSELMHRYRIGSLLRRRKVKTKYNPPRLYEYRVTETGLRRLEYLTSAEMKSAGVVKEELGLRGSRIGTYIAGKLGGE